MKILITGCAGFIGFHLARKLLNTGNIVHGVDTLNDYYNRELKIHRLAILKKEKKFSFNKVDISNFYALKKIFNNKKFDSVINLAAYAGVSYSLKFPEKYIQTNEVGFFNILELVKSFKVKKLLFASSSSVYGTNKLPFKESQITDNPLSLYGATKKNNEILASYYSKEFNITIIGIRFFTVYGPYGRPDLSIFKFCEQIINNKTVTLYNYGNNFRDFTYIDDLVDNLNRLIKLRNFTSKDKRKFHLLNISSGKKIKILNLIKMIEKALGKKAKTKLIKKLSYDIPASLSYSTNLKKLIKVRKKTQIKDGINKFVKWYQNYYL